jgi:tetraacyldisaccharide 4'-kinase
LTLLKPLGLLYAFLAKCRRGLYARDLLKTQKVEAPVISIGNLAVGGNRKTPLAAWVAEVLSQHGFKPAILSRGHSRKIPRYSPEPLVVSQGAGPLVTPEVAGDEPYLLASQTSAMVVVAKKRFLAARLAISLGANILILDDGFQHLGLSRDLDILSLVGAKPFGNGLVLPAGPLRESLATGSRADLCLVSADAPSNPWRLPQFEASLELIGLRDLKTNELFNLEAIQKSRLAAFCGLAKPWEFQKSLKNWGLEPVVLRAFPDHAKYDQAQKRELIKFHKCSQAEWLLTTPKDAVKLKGLNLPILAVETKLTPKEPLQLVSSLMAILRHKGWTI